MSWQDEYLARFYDRTTGWVDGTTQFWEMCSREINVGSRILEIGAGPTNPTSRFLATLGLLDGIDIDPEVASNEALQATALIEDGRFPSADSTYDACVSNYVMEHIRDPQKHMLEVARVLKPGGKYLFRTPNRYHYVSLVAKATPHDFHRWIANPLRGLPPGTHEPYPTFHRLNSRRAISRHAIEAGLELHTAQMVEKEPSYGMAARPLFLLLMAYERAVNSTEALGVLRANIFGVLVKGKSPSLE
jgi:SAM-dependent methyltransferase